MKAADKMLGVEPFEKAVVKMGLADGEKVKRLAQVFRNVPELVIIRWAHEINCNDWPYDFPLPKPKALEKPDKDMTVGRHKMGSHFMATVLYLAALNSLIRDDEAEGRYHFLYYLGETEEHYQKWLKWKGKFCQEKETMKNCPKSSRWQESLWKRIQKNRKVLEKMLK